MERILSVTLLTLLIGFVWIYDVPAAAWEIGYLGDKLPDDPSLGNEKWNVFMTAGMKVADVAEITPNEELHINDPNDKVCFFLYEDVGEVGKATVEARVKVLSQSGATYSILMGIEDAAGYAWLDLYPDQIQLEGGASHNVDMTEYHILRVTRDDNEVIVYIDDEEVLDGVPSSSDGRHDIIFGAGSTGGTGEHYWDYVAFTTKGAFSPEELPNFQSFLAVNGKEKAVTYWGKIKSRY